MATNVPGDLQYTRSDEWIRLEGGIATIGITDYAQHELGELVYVELPEIGSTLKPEVSFGVVESVKAVAELLSPVEGEVIATNEAVADDSALVNSSPYEEGWLVKVKIIGSPVGAMSPAEYAAYRK